MVQSHAVAVMRSHAAFRMVSSVSLQSEGQECQHAAFDKPHMAGRLCLRSSPHVRDCVRPLAAGFPTKQRWRWLD